VIKLRKIISAWFLFLIVLFLINFASADFFDWFGKFTGHATQQNTNVSVTLNGTNGVIVVVTNFSTAIIPTENSFTPATFYVQVTDPDGVSDINDTSINATFFRSGETARSNSTCSLVEDISSTTANYSCTINMWYYDGAGVWDITACARDLGNTTYVCNSTTTFTYNQLQALVISPNSLTWATLTPGMVNQTSNNDPSVINNTGNYNFPNVTVRGHNLHGEAVTSAYISVRNFTVGSRTGSNAECDVSPASNATLLVNGTNVQILDTILSKGNHSVNNGVTGQEQLYYCINTVPQVQSQIYSTKYSGGSWIIIGTT